MSPAVADDDAVIGGLLVSGRIPSDLRARVRPELFLPERRALLQAMLATPDGFEWQTLLRHVYGYEDATAWERRFSLAAAYPETLEVYVRLLEMRAKIGFREEAPKPVPEPTRLADALDALMGAVRAGPPECIATPFPTLNRFLAGGFAPGELVYLGAYPGVGKSALALELARHAAKAGKHVLIVSAEMLNVALARRMLAQESRVRATAIKTGRLGAGEWVLLEGALRRLRGLPVWLTDQARSMHQIEAMLQQLPVGFLIVDYLQLLEGEPNSESRRQEIEGLSKGLKRLAVSAGIPVLSISSLPYPPDGRQGEPPMRLKESSGLNHDGDVILLLHRKEDEMETSCRVAKNRDGETGKAMLRFRAEYVSFEEEERREE